MQNYTRKKRREEPVKNAKPVKNYKPTDDDLRWIKFIQQGKIFFSSMLLNYNFMIDTEIFSNHFSIFDGVWPIDSDEVLETHGTEIQKELLPWIQKEYDSGHLFQYEYWRSFRDPSTITRSFFGYKRMFQYKHHYFQLSIEIGCDTYKSCSYCPKTRMPVHFELAYYGWKDEKYSMLQPNNHIPIPMDDMIMPESEWKGERKLHILN